MLVGNSFDLWRKDAFFFAADEVQESADILLSGVVGVGVAGIILVTGLTFVALSLGKRAGSRPEQQMKPLMTQQEVLLSSDDHDDEVTVKKMLTTRWSKKMVKWRSDRYIQGLFIS